jgi:hypothetical protein
MTPPLWLLASPTSKPTRSPCASPKRRPTRLLPPLSAYAALARVLQTKGEVTTAAKDHGANAQRTSEALPCTAKERVAVAAPESSGATSEGAPTPTTDLCAAVLLHEVVALLHKAPLCLWRKMH